MREYTLKEVADKSAELGGCKIKVHGWIRTVRDGKNFAFVELTDGTKFKTTQVVADSSMPGYKELVSQNVGAAVAVEGTLVLTPEAKQPYEIKADKAEILAVSTPEYPLQKKRHTFEFLREIAHLRPRANTFQAVFRVRSVAAQAIHAFFASRGFIYVNTPLITGSDCEGAGEMFRVTTLDPVKPPLKEDGAVDWSQDFFGKQSNLTVSGQLNAECFALAFSNVYTFGPTFRAEKSYTNRHAAEFWMIEPEIAFADLDDDMDLARDMIKYVIADVLEKCPEEMKFFNDFMDKGLLERLRHIVDSEFRKVTYTEAIRLLQEHKDEFKFPVEWGCDLQTEHERYLTEKIFGTPIFVTDYPKEIKAFYMRLNDDC